MRADLLVSTAARLLQQALRFEHPADAMLARFVREHRSLGPRERARLGDALYAVLRRRRLFEHLARRGAQGVPPPDGQDLHERLALLGLALDGGAPLRAADEATTAWIEACRGIDAAALPEACRHNLPDWLATRLQAEVEDGFWPLAEALLQPAPLDVRVNILKEKRPAAQAQLAQAAIESEATSYSPWGLRVAGKPSLARVPAFASGAIEVQDEGSQLLALLLEARRNELVVDFCAGAGGKTLAIGAAMRNTGRLYAFDTSAHRLEALKPRLARSGLANVHTAAIAHERDARVKALTGKADRVLVDAPCSGLGTLRRAPDIKWRTSAADVAAYAVQQAAILRAAAALVKPGGRLVYATCSLLEEEDEALAGAFSAEERDFVPLHAGERLAALKVPGADALATAAGHLRLWPHRHGTDGFFAALWQRKA